MNVETLDEDQKNRLKNRLNNRIEIYNTKQVKIV